MPAQLILSCVFHWIEGYCSDRDSPERFDTFIKTIDWRLPDVVWDWSAAPPPPPPISNSGPYRRLVGGDPEGFELVREKLLECWPPLQYVASQTMGSNVGRDRSTDGRGYGPIYYVSRYSMSTAYLSTVNYEDQDSLSARMMQARFSGMFRFSCRCFIDWMSDPSTAAAGVGAGTDPEARKNNPPEFGGCANRYPPPYHSPITHSFPLPVQTQGVGSQLSNLRVVAVR